MLESTQIILQIYCSYIVNTNNNKARPSKREDFIYQLLWLGMLCSIYVILFSLPENYSEFISEIEILHNPSALCWYTNTPTANSVWIFTLCCFIQIITMKL